MDSRVNNKVSYLPARSGGLRLIAETADPQVLIEFIEYLIEKKVLIEPITFSSILRHARRLSGKTLPEVAGCMMVNPDTFTEWANGRWLPNPEPRIVHIRTLSSILRRCDQCNS